MAYTNTGWNETRYNRDAAAARRQQTASGLTGSFAQQAAANPYVGREFSPTFWQSLGERWFQDYSARDRFYAEQDQAADEYLAQLLDAQRQQEFNSPAAQAARERGAGLNPDLIGVGTGEQPAPAVNPDDTPPGMGTTEAPVSGADVANAVSFTGKLLSMPMDFLGSVIEMSDSILTLGMKSDQRKWSEVSNWLNSNPAVSAYLASTDVAEVPERIAALSGGADYYRGIQSSVVSGAQFRGLSKGAQGLLKSLIGTSKYDKNGHETPGLVNARKALQKDTKGLEKSLVDIMNSPGYSDDFATWVGQNYAAFAENANRAVQLEQQLRIDLAKAGMYLNSEGVITLRASAEKAGYRAGIAEGTFESEYYQAMDAADAASGENEQNKFKAASAALATWQKNMESQEEELYRGNLRRIEENRYYKYNPAVKAAALMAEHRRHADFIANLYNQSESFTNQLLEKGADLGSAVVNKRVPGRKSTK